MEEEDPFPLNPLFMQYGGRAIDKRLLEQWIILLGKEIDKFKKGSKRVSSR
ncbi:MAG: hypothetical protein ACTSUF_04990 [Candidatus Heimdallarchaeaceae archaeon]